MMAFEPNHVWLLTIWPRETKTAQKLVYKLSTWQAFVCDAKLQIPKFGWVQKANSIFFPSPVGFKSDNAP